MLRKIASPASPARNSKPPRGTVKLRQLGRQQRQFVGVEPTRELGLRQRQALARVRRQVGQQAVFGRFERLVGGGSELQRGGAAGDRGFEDVAPRITRRPLADHQRALFSRASLASSSRMRAPVLSMSWTWRRSSTIVCAL